MNRHLVIWGKELQKERQERLGVCALHSPEPCPPRALPGEDLAHLVACADSHLSPTLFFLKFLALCPAEDIGGTRSPSLVLVWKAFVRDCAASQVALVAKNRPATARDGGSIPGL